MRRFDIPAAPLVADRRGGELIRIVEPIGRAVAWLAPGTGRCVGYAVRPATTTVGGWRQLFRVQDRPVPNERSAAQALGIGTDWPWPDAAPPAAPARWHLIERDPTAATCACRCVSTTDPPGIADLTLAMWLDGGALRCSLAAQFSGSNIAPSRPRLRVVLPNCCTGPQSGLLSDDRPSAGALLKLRCGDTALQLTASSESPHLASWSCARDGDAGLICIAQPAPVVPGVPQPTTTRLTIALHIAD